MTLWPFLPTLLLHLYCHLSPPMSLRDSDIYSQTGSRSVQPQCDLGEKGLSVLIPQLWGIIHSVSGKPLLSLGNEK